VQHLWLQQKTHRYYAFSPEKTNHLPDNDDDDGHLWNSETRQILGLKNPAETTELWKIRLQLAKPISWVPLSVLVLCGAIASGHFQWNSNSDTMMMIDHALIRVIAAMILAGPCSEGFAQTINDWYDRDIDAINEPYRPIPAGKITPAQVWEQLLALFLVGIAIAVGLDATASASTLPEQGSSSNFPMVTAIAIVGYIISYLYSAPPVKLKQNGITGDLAICICYIAFPFWVGQAVFGGLQQPVDWLL
jgi:chlorophyll synthase